MNQRLQMLILTIFLIAMLSIGIGIHLAARSNEKALTNPQAAKIEKIGLGWQVVVLKVTYEGRSWIVFDGEGTWAQEITKKGGGDGPQGKAEEAEVRQLP